MYSAQRGDDDMAEHRRTKVWAHRGYSSTYPENTMPAFQAALDIGVDGIEFDIHLTKDGHIVVHHDEQVDRTSNGSGWIRDLTLEEIQRLDAGSWFGPAFAGTRIPTLEAVLRLIADSKRTVEVNIERKAGMVAYPGLEEQAWQMVCAYGLTNQVIFSSFNHFVLRDLKSAHPEAKIGLLYMEGLVNPWVYAKHLDATAIHPFYLSIDREVVEGTRNCGIAVHTFTVDDVESAERLMRWGVDAIITDDPAVMLQVVGHPNAHAAARGV
ncbi:glycerophosphodiester phosphodiesterase [Alicyclobacillus pomorum]